MKNVVLIGGVHIQDHEFFYPKYRLSEELNIKTLVATPNNESVMTNKGSKILSDLAIEVLRVEDFDGVVIPGGAHAIEYLRQNRKLIDFVQGMNLAKKPIASICQGSQILISAKAVPGRKVSGYYSISEDITNAGGIYLDLPVVIDANLITTAHYKHMGPWMKEFILSLN